MKWLAALIITCNVVSQSWAGLPVITVSGLDVEPYIINEEGSERPSGIIVDIVDEVMSRIGHQPKYNITVWARAFNDVSKGYEDALIPAMKTASREQLLWYPEEPLLSLRMSLFKAKNANVAWDGAMDSLQNTRIAVVRGAKVSPSFDQVLDSGLFKVEKKNKL